MTPLWTAVEAEAATGGKVLGHWSVQAVSIDTRALGEKTLFVALAGENRDGHAFAPEASQAGAVVMVAREEGLPAGAPRLVVQDTLKGLEALGVTARARTDARIVAVTGSVGKTGTKEALRHVLAAQDRTHASIASYNNHWGVPLSLARMPKATRFGVFELGMNHAGEISALTRMVRPHVAIITRIAPAHLEYFGTLEKIADAKAEIFAGLEQGGVAVLPRDDVQFDRLARAARENGADIVSFGSHEAADWRLLAFEPTAEGSHVELSHKDRSLRFALGAPGRHWAQNALAVLAAVDALGGDVEAAALALAEFQPPGGRGQRRPIKVKGGMALLLDESYNANPTSMQAAIDVLGQRPGRRIAVLGDMLELGASAPDLHAGLAPLLSEAHVDLVFLAGPLMRHLFDALPTDRRGAYRPTAKELVDPVEAVLQPGDTVLVKGSLGSRMKLIVDALAGKEEVA
ncbi:UDP-N-acetylmuramoyl-tripeptide--D-alanyl-D-alanine ligase [Arboricoccus pini]|uniref:UDP-N-acetylmuramoyl-tripeptide--D-alanyl-D-alanine ligase n=1 Tax=Arboricoccus pini TaxID=1963835 RepID=A0A212QA69_9PROT|nr:UDP-N-acetylmuramoylalanyl-D-glutamyl-2,6-diaminopimelate--D-alanyl-D-alanine ligase [Arboricoccus pini]SNB56222.1 UDP-N-acetylmuramoyl-tripeptide--D-alanyl-D-alanine ligase [Arboricoccus pini]